MNDLILTNKTLKSNRNNLELNYPDQWNQNILFYVGMDLHGDQSLMHAQNKNLFYSNQNGMEVYLFINYQPDHYQYLGPVKLVEKPYLKYNTYEKRELAIFPIQPINYTAKQVQNTLSSINHKKLKK